MSGRRRGPPPVFAALIALVVAGGLVALYVGTDRGSGSTGRSGPGTAGAYAFQVGKPGVGQSAPPVRLASTAGGTFDLASQQGHTTLLYFQEGLTCQPCWDQLADIQKHAAAFKAAGVDTIISVTTDPLDALRQRSPTKGSRSRCFPIRTSRSRRHSKQTATA